MPRFLLVLLVLSIFCVPAPWSAQADACGSGQPTHRVKKGDTLYEIARKAHIPLAELKRLNRLSSNKIKPGQLLVVGRKPVSAERPAAVAKRDSDEKSQPASGASSIFEKAALSFLDTPYRFGGAGQKGTDCSGFVQQVFKEFNFRLPHSAREQYTLGTKVPKDDLQAGDLVFFRTYARYPSHVGIYLGDNKMIHASTRSRGVVVSDIDSRYFRKRYIGAKRLALNHDQLKLDEIFRDIREDTMGDKADGPEEGAVVTERNG